MPYDELDDDLVEKANEQWEALPPERVLELLLLKSDGRRAYDQAAAEFTDATLERIRREARDGVPGEVYEFRDEEAEMFTLRWVCGTNAFQVLDDGDGEFLFWVAAPEIPRTIADARAFASAAIREMWEDAGLDHDDEGEPCG
jgi:hypothetical protein